MTKGHVIGVGVLVTAVAVVLIVGVAARGLLELHHYYDEGLLGPGDERQRVEVPEHGFAISLADDWMTEAPLPDPQEDERLGMHALYQVNWTRRQRNASDFLDDLFAVAPDSIDGLVRAARVDLADGKLPAARERIERLVALAPGRASRGSFAPPPPKPHQGLSPAIARLLERSRGA